MAANMYRFRANLGGFTGAPGINTYFIRYPAEPIAAEVQESANLLRSAYVDMSLYIAGGVTVNIDPQVDVIRDTDGVLQSSSVITPPLTVTGQGSQNKVSRATQLVARYDTDAVVAGRRLRGRSFIGPASGDALNADGSVATAAITAVSSAFDGLLDVLEGRLVVFHRPSVPGASDGTSGFVQSVGCKPLPGVLRKRRD